jgi:hypothetical protein
MSVPNPTPVQFLVSQAQLDSMTMYIYIGIAGIIAFFGLMVYVLQDKMRTPKQAGSLTAAHRRHVPLILLAGLDHFADLYPIKEFIPEVLQTNPFGKGVKKHWYRFILPQKVNVTELNLQVDSDRNEHKTVQYIQAMNDLNNSKVTLRGVNSPIFVGTKNRSIAASFPFLSALSWTRDIESLSKNPEVVRALQGHHDLRVRNIGEILSRLMTGVSGVDFHAVYKNIDVNYDHTISDSIRERDNADGRMERSEDKDKPTKTVLYLILGILGLGVLLTVMAKVL